ncbi:hypothetical protein GCM10010483_13140 [Actinokineospora diospyrosa]
MSVAGLPFVAVSPAAAELACTAAVNVFGVEPDGRMFVYPHNEPETGVASWGAKHYIGSGWNGGTTYAAPGGYIHHITTGNRQHRRYQWTGSGWASFGGGQYQDLGVVDPSTRPLVDEQGRFYKQDDRRFFVSSWDDQGRLTADEVPLSPAVRPNVITSGSSAFFARADGDLYRYRFDFENNRWLTIGERIGAGFGVFKRLISAGGGVLYGVANDPAGTLVWYRYDDQKREWANNGIGKVVGSGWGALAEVTASGCAAPDQQSNPLPGPRGERPRLVYNPATRTFEAAWVNNSGELLYGKENPQDPTAITWTALTGYQNHTGAVSALRDGGTGRLLLSAPSQDGRGRMYVQQPDGSFGSGTGIGGRFTVGPVLTSAFANDVAVYGIDDRGMVYNAKRGSDTSSPWFPAAQRLGQDTTIGLASGPTAVTRTATGELEVRRPPFTTYDPPVPVRGLRVVGTPHITQGENGPSRLIARDENGKLWTSEEKPYLTGPGFGPWTDISGGLTFTGTVDTAFSFGPRKTEIVARTTDGTVVRRQITDWAVPPAWIPIGTSAVDPVIAVANLQVGKAVLLVDGSGQAKLVRIPYQS